MSNTKQNPNSQVGRRKRGRPALKIEKPQETSIFGGNLGRGLIDSYESKLSCYEASNFTQNLSLMLQRIAMEDSLQMYWKEPVYQSLAKVAKEAMLSKVEIAIWSLVLAATKPLDASMDLLLYLRLSAYAVKCLLEGDVGGEIRGYLDTKPGFLGTSPGWIEPLLPQLDISIIEVNQKYSQLNKVYSTEEASTFPFNFYVDEIIDEPLNQNESYMLTSPVQGFCSPAVRSSNQSFDMGPPSKKNSLLFEQNSKLFERHPSFLLNISRGSSSNSGQFQMSPQFFIPETTETPERSQVPKSCDGR